MFAVFYWFNSLYLLPTAVSQPGSKPIFNTFACQQACLIHAWKTLKMVFDINANNSVYHCCPGSTPDSQQEHTNTHTRHVKPEEMPNAKVCHVSVPNRTRCSPFNACWLLHKHCALTFIWAFYIKVVELNMKSGTQALLLVLAVSTEANTCIRTNLNSKQKHKWTTVTTGRHNNI